VRGKSPFEFDEQLLYLGINRLCLMSNHAVDRRIMYGERCMGITELCHHKYSIEWFAEGRLVRIPFGKECE
jgi:hypothetical protein